MRDVQKVKQILLGRRKGDSPYSGLYLRGAVHAEAANVLLSRKYASKLSDKVIRYLLANFNNTLSTLLMQKIDRQRQLIYIYTIVYSTLIFNHSIAIIHKNASGNQ